jgi:hypothetical protein
MMEKQPGNMIDEFRRCVPYPGAYIRRAVAEWSYQQPGTLELWTGARMQAWWSMNLDMNA